MAPEFTTERLHLRNWRESDTDAFYAFYRDPQSEAAAIVEFLDGLPTIDSMLAAIDPALYRNRAP